MDAQAAADDDPYLWLEEVTGDEALAWVRDRSKEAVAELAASERYAAIKAEVLDALDAEDRIPYVVRRGEFLYNFWRDAAHPKGLWRRTTLDDYRRPEPDWDVLIDVDALAAAEDENWVWHGAAVLRPAYEKALVDLSRGGADATVVREFDMTTRAFVDGGFTLPEAKSDVGWVDDDTIFVGTDIGPGSLTTSGYPRIVQRWRRGTPLAEAETVFEGQADDVAAYGHHDPTEGYERDFVGRAPDFFTDETFLLGPGDTLTKLDVPDDASSSVHRQWLLVRLRTAVGAGGRGPRAPRRGAAGHRARRLPGRRPGVHRPVRPRRAHLAAGVVVDEELPRALAAAGREGPAGGAHAARRRRRRHRLDRAVARRAPPGRARRGRGPHRRHRPRRERRVLPGRRVVHRPAHPAARRAGRRGRAAAAGAARASTPPASCPASSSPPPTTARRCPTSSSAPRTPRRRPAPRCSPATAGSRCRRRRRTAPPSGGAG